MQCIYTSRVSYNSYFHYIKINPRLEASKREKEFVAKRHEEDNSYNEIAFVNRCRTVISSNLIFLDFCI